MFSQLHCDGYVSSMSQVNTVYGKTFEWEDFHGLYANGHPWENVHGCLLSSCHILYETYRITYSIRLHRKIFEIECKIAKSAKVFPFESFAVYGMYLLILN